MVRLTRTEFRLLYVLAVNAGRVVAGARLVEYVWGYDGSSVSLLKTHISHLRRKLRLGLTGIGSITCVPGVGYRLSPRPAGGVSETQVSDMASRTEGISAAQVEEDGLHQPVQVAA